MSVSTFAQSQLGLAHTQTMVAAHGRDSSSSSGAEAGAQGVTVAAAFVDCRNPIFAALNPPFRVFRPSLYVFGGGIEDS